MENKRRLIILSNRLPFRISDKKKKSNIELTDGGLVSAITSYIKNNQTAFNKVIWIGLNETDSVADKNLEIENIHIHSISIPTVLYHKYYNGFCNQTLWPLFHYFPSITKFNQDDYNSYREVNLIVSHKLTEIITEGDIVWIHDFHFMLLPSLLRQKYPAITIGFFLHIPFPSYEIFRLLPHDWRAQILNGLLGANLIGFHTNDYAEYFSQCIKRICGYEVQQNFIYSEYGISKAGSFPISIDYEKYSNAYDLEKIVNERNKLRKKFNDQKLIISVDRLDYSKGLLYRLEGFELFLESNPAHLGKVVYLMVVVPSREHVEKYREIKRSVEQTVSRINGRFGTLDWVPVIYQYKKIDFNKLITLYGIADIALVTPIRDGMNLVSKEYVAAKRNKKGVLILSEMAGSAAELSEAILINPTDKVQLSKAIQFGLGMSTEEKQKRMEGMQSKIKKYDVNRWAEDFLCNLHFSAKKQLEYGIKMIKENEMIKIKESYIQSSNRLLLLDYDGTLVPFEKNPSLALPTSLLYELLLKLYSDSQNTVAIVSGRSVNELNKWFGHLPISIIAEHGTFFKDIYGEWEQICQTKPDWKEYIKEIMYGYLEHCPGSFIEEKSFSIAWHYRNSESELAHVRANQLLNELERYSKELGYSLINGDKIIEARILGIDKGSTVREKMLGNRFDFIMAIGDDTTDEDLFKVLPSSAFSIKVGFPPTYAQYNILNQSGIIDLLSSMSSN